MAGVQVGRSLFLFHSISIALLHLLLTGTQGASALSTHSDDVVAEEATAPPRSTLFLYGLCGSSSEGRVGWCEGYLMGLADILLAMGNSGVAGGICKAEYDAATLNGVFRSWAQHHPERWKDDMAVSVQASFREAWPCW